MFFVVSVSWFLLSLFCGMTSYGLAPRVHEAATVSASLAVINTASKHLHNDLARAIVGLVEHHHTASALQAQEANYSIGFICSN